MTKNKRKAMDLLRKAAEALSQLRTEDFQGEGIADRGIVDRPFVLFPGWDFDNIDDAGTALGAKIVHAAKGVAAENVDFDHGNYVSCHNLGHLVRYIGDMLEE